MMQSQALAAIIRKAEEDYAGLWEIPILLRTLGVDTPERAAVACVQKLLEKGLIAAVWGNPDPDSSAPLSSAENQRVMSDESFWRDDVPYQGRTVWLYATPTGEQWVEKLTAAV